MTAELREMIEAQKAELSKTWKDPDTRFPRWTGAATVEDPPEVDTPNLAAEIVDAAIRRVVA